jgi:iron complex outermembrane receptor protein
MLNNSVGVRRARRHIVSTGALAIASLTILAAPALPAESPQSGTAELEEVMVTSTRIARSGFTAPTPTTMLSAAEIQRSAPNNLTEVMRELPAYRATASPTTNAISGPASTIDLRGLGAGRTLTLVNGRRYVPSGNNGGVVNLNLIPTALIDRLEVVTGGASAAWGSDAVAGVVNVILKDDLRGFEASAQGGVSGYGDAENSTISFAGGGGFDGDRGHIVVGGEYSDDQGIASRENRENDWIHQRGAVANPGWATNGRPALIFTEGLQFANQAPGGVITGPLPAGSALRGITFNADGTTGRLTFGEVFGANMIGGSQPGNYFNYLNQYMQPIKRYSMYAHANYQLTDKVRATVEVSAAQTKSDFRTTPNRDAGATSATVPAPPTPVGQLIARIENPFMPASVRAQIVAAGLNAVYVGRDAYNELGVIGFTQTSRAMRYMGALEGEISEKGNWRWDAYYQYARAPFRNTRYGPNSRDMSKWREATDVVVNPANGQPICRSTLTNPSNGCAPYNIFGEGVATPAARRYIQADGLTTGLATSQVMAANLQGEVFNVPAGPVSLAVGAEYRKEETQTRLDPVAAAANYEFAGSPQPAFQSAGNNLWEAYAEVVLPLLKNAAIAKSLDLNLAGRHTDYSTSGGVDTWKAGVTWEVNDSLRFRSTLSRDIRAPNLNELFAPSVGAGAFLPTDRVLNVPSLGVVTTTGSGNPNLDPEEAKTFTAGVGFQPSWAPGLRLSVDYYSVEIQGQITQVNGQEIINRCALGLTSYCPLIQRNPDPTNAYITGVRSPFLNLNEYRTKGVDIEAVWTTGLFNIPGNFIVRGLASYTHELVTKDALGEVDRAGQLGGTTGLPPGVPHWQGTGTVTYNRGDFSGTLQGRFVQSGNIDNTYVPGTASSANIYTVPHQILWNLSASYTFNRPIGTIQVFGNVNNLLDTNPPFPFLPSSLYPSGYYDGIGRAFRMGVRLKL